MIAPDDHRTAIVVEVPAAEDCIASLCARRGPAAGPAIPAHLTILYPFMEPAAVDDGVLGRLAGAVADVAPFRFTLTHVDAFPEVVILAPHPAAAFSDLVARVCAAFPGFPPYEGRHARVVPHVTVAHVRPDERAAVVALAASLLPAGGITSECRALTVMENASGRWLPWRRVPLGG